MLRSFVRTDTRTFSFCFSKVKPGPRTEGPQERVSVSFTGGDADVVMVRFRQLIRTVTDNVEHITERLVERGVGVDRGGEGSGGEKGISMKNRSTC